MTYANIKKLFSSSSADTSAELLNNMITDKVNCRLVYVVGDDTDACGAFVSSVLQKANVRAGRAQSCDGLEARKLFSAETEFVSPQELCEFTNTVPSPKSFSKEALSLLFALDCFGKKGCEAIIFETTEEFFKSTLSKLKITPDIVIFTSFEEKTVSDLITALPRGVKDAICFSDLDNYDYISSKYTNEGTRVSVVSKNKINAVKTSFFGTDFYYNSQPYTTRATAPENIIHAALALECISALSRLGLTFSKYSLTKGLGCASLLFDLELFSLSPAIILKAGRFSEEKVASFLKADTLTIIKEEDIPTSTFHKTVKSLLEQNNSDILLFSGSLDFIGKIRKELELIKK